MRVALDAMGGDEAPQPNIRGAVAALEANPELTIFLVGDAAELEDQLPKSSALRERLRVQPAEGFVGMQEKPTEALRKKPNCSIAVCWKLMAGREVDAVISAGHTGAVVAAGLRTRLFLKGVRRPGIAVALPTIKGRSVLMDVGANPAARPEHLMQYAVMGSIYARGVLGIASPTIGLMNIGSEDGKGTELVRETHALLLGSRLRSQYVGNVEGRGLYQGEADVVICEGFVGNVVLKVSEGMADMLFRRLAGAVLEGLDGEKHLAQRAIDELNKQYQYQSEGGAPLLGIDGICIICHGASDETSIANALRVAGALRSRGINSQIVDQLDCGG